MNIARDSPDVLILGGGPAGSAAAIQLARAGRRVTLIEQTTAAHHKVCGEFVSREAIASLDRLGLDLQALGAAPIHAVRLAGRREIAACDLPFSALSLTRRTLDEELLALAYQAGATVLRGRRVDALRPSGSGWTAHVEGEELHAPAAFLASGKHDLHEHRRPPGRQNHLIAFKMYFRMSAALQHALHGWIELFLFPGGYAGLQLAEDGEANLCLVVNRSKLRQCENRWPALLDHLCQSSQHLAARLDGAQPLLPKPLALSAIPYGMLRRDAPPGLWLLGDQAAVIPSFAGDGMAIALHSAQHAANMYGRGASSDTFARQLHDQLHRPVNLATQISQLMVTAPMLAQATCVWPALLQLIATRTRIPANVWV